MEELSLVCVSDRLCWTNQGCAHTFPREAGMLSQEGKEGLQSKESFFEFVGRIALELYLHLC